MIFIYVNVLEFISDMIILFYEIFDGCFWIGIDGGGFFYYEKGKFICFEIVGGFECVIVCLICLVFGMMCVFLSNCLFYFDQGCFKNEFLFFGVLFLIGLCVWLYCRNGEWWMGGEFVFFCFVVDGFFFGGCFEGFFSFYICDLVEDLVGDVWVVSSDGLFYWCDDQFCFYIFIDGFVIDIICIVYFDCYGMFWVGIINGL